MLGIIFVVAIVILIVMIIIALLFERIQIHLEKYHTHNKVYKVLKSFADENDHYLLNDVELYMDSRNAEPTVFDHILFADKYIYVISDLTAFGGIYGNAKDATLFLKNEKGEIKNINNPLLTCERKVRLLEAAIGANSSKHLIIGVTVYNNSLIVPKNIKVKNQDNCFLPVKELYETLEEAEKDDVTSFEDRKTKELVDMIKKRSDAVKEDVRRNKTKLRKRK